MFLVDLLPFGHIVPSLRATSRWQAIRELLECLISAGAVSAASRDAVHAALVAREERMSTGIGRGVAVPHATTAGVDRPLAALGRSVTGVDFDAMDGAPVHVVFLLLMPTGDPARHLITLSELSRALTRPEVMTQLKTADTAAEIHAVLAPGNAAVRV